MVQFCSLCFVKIKMSKKKDSGPKIYNFFAKTKQKKYSSSEFYQSCLPNPVNESNDSHNQTIKMTNSQAENEMLEQTTTAADIHTENEVQKSNCDEIAKLKLELEMIKAENVKLKKENTKYVTDLRSMKKLLNETCVSHASKELKIRILEKKHSQGKSMFDDHKEILREPALKQLRKISVNRRSDSTFVLKIMQNLYSDNIEDLKMKTVCGRAANGFISPTTTTMIKDLLTERLLNLNLTEPQFNERFNRANELINNAIKNILRQKVCTELFDTVVCSIIF